MKRRDYFLILLLLALFAGLWIWFPSPPKSASTVSLDLTTNAPGMATNGFTFRLKNSGPRAFFLSRIFVDVKTPGGWRMVSLIAPAEDQVVAPGGAKDLTVNSPGGSDPWRLRIAYGWQLEGFRFFMVKMEVALHDGKFPGAGFGAFAGSNSVSSAEIAR